MGTNEVRMSFSIPFTELQTKKALNPSEYKLQFKIDLLPFTTSQLNAQDN